MLWNINKCCYDTDENCEWIISDLLIIVTILNISVINVVST